MSEIQHRDALKAGYKLHWYAIERILGQGGFGITYLARDTNLDKLVAIKEFLPAEMAVRTDDLTVQPRTGSDSKQYTWGLDRFLYEAQTLAQFDHPNIARIFSVFEANHTAYLVMRYEQGVSFNEYLERHNHLDEGELMNILLPVLDGLKIVHEAGFIHRDIQPANIFIRKDGSPVLLDFGAAREATGKPRTLTILIAPGYAPFEQYYSSSKEQGPWTDIYALGATMYRSIAGVAPIDAIERSRGMLGSTRDLLVPASVIGEGRYSEKFLSAIDHALKFSEKDRPQTIAAWLVELGPGTGGKTGPDTLPQADKLRTPGTAETRDDSLPTGVERKTGLSTYVRAITLVVVFALGTGLGMLLLRYSGRDTAPAAERGSTETPVAGPSTGPIRFTEDTPETTAASAQKVTLPESDHVAARPAANDPDNGTIENESATGLESTGRLLDRINEIEKRIADQNHLVEGIVNRGENTENQEQLKMANMRKELDELVAMRQEEQRKIAELELKRKQAEDDINKIKAASPPPEKVIASASEKTPAPVRDTTLDTALNAYNAGDYKTALELFGPLANKGDPVAKYHLAVMYRNGQGILANNNIALNWMLSAAGDGETDAQIGLAGMYYTGIDGVQDPFLAYTWYLVAEKNDVYKVIVERRKAESELQPEQLPQAAALATELHKQQGLQPVGKGAIK